MALPGRALLAVWNEVDPAAEADFDDWYLREHIPERTSVPGMLRGRRYRALDGGSPVNMALYEARTLDVLTSGAYRAQLANPTTWTKRVTSNFRFMRRGICEVVATVGQGVGGFATVLHLRPVAGGEASLRVWVERIVPVLAGMRQVAAAHAWVAAPGEPVSPTTAFSRGAEVHGPVNWVLAIEAADQAALLAARDAALADDPVAHGAAEAQVYPVYQLLYVLTSD